MLYVKVTSKFLGLTIVYNLWFNVILVRVSWSLFSSVSLGRFMHEQFNCKEQCSVLFVFEVVRQCFPCENS